VKLVAISVDETEDSVALAGKLGITFPLLKDEGLKTALAYGVAMQGDEIAVPAVFVISREKKITFQHVGESVVDRPGVGGLLDELDKLK
jgi:peroxiredoxin